ncbi:MAG: ribonuclease HII [Chromatiales bacterium]|nr:ribonuclease HII [Chromatiales bacterium]
MNWIAGIDEAGRGPLAGPVTVAAVILPPDHGLAGLDDSKRLSAARREVLAGAIRERAVAWTVVHVEREEIDRLNILGATLAGMRRSVEALAVRPALALVDGNRAPQLPCAAVPLVQGDRLAPVISAASILAKVARDTLMRVLDDRYPGYGFARHFGYPTAAHLAALERHGPCVEHRRSFAPVRRLIETAT